MKPVLQVLLLVSALLPASVATRAQPQRDAEEIGLSGYVLAPDGTPVSSGSVLIQSPAARASASIERTGRFRLIPNVPGVHQISVSVSGLAPYRVNVTVPPSRTLRLPMIRLSPATYVRQVDVPDGLRAIAIAIPDGFLPLHLTHAITNEPVTTAAITWTGGGARVEAKASGNGDALLEGMDPTGGTLAITASGYEPAELKLSEPTTIVQELALMPAPATSLRPRVITTSGEPVPNAVVELLPANPIEAGHVAVADAKGFVSFSDVPPGALRLVASADRFVTAAMQVAGDSRSDIVLTLSPGYRVIAIVESSAEPGPHLVRVVNEAGASMEGLLDTASDRSIEPPGRISLGPLAPGTYVVELLGPREHRQERVRIVDRDIIATFR